jgi:hypothetical protein
MLLQEIETVQYFPPNVPPQQFSLWEMRNSAAFKNVYAFIEDLSAANKIADKFHWDYVFLRHFKEVRILTPKFNGFTQAKEAFLHCIAKIKGGGEKKFQRVVKTVRIMEIEGAQLQELRRRLQYNAWEGRLWRETDDAAQAMQFKNVWLYELQRNELTIGFVDSWPATEGLSSPTSRGEVSRAVPISATLSKGEVSMLLPHLTSPWAK